MTAMQLAATTPRQFTAVVELNAGCEPADHRSRSRKIYGEVRSWSITPLTLRKVQVQFWDTRADDAIGYVHRLMQREARSKACADNYRKKRAKYGVNDYKIVELSDNQSGTFDLPGGANLDCQPKPRVKKVDNQIEMEMV